MRYEAFISYSHDDEKWAAWIHRSLEGFRIPKGLAEELGRPGNRLLPVFRDRDELASSADLSDTLLEALQASRNLIVVCSPASAASRWVNEEVVTFQALGRADRVFCVIVGGDPGDPASCFPESLRNTEPLAADLRPGRDGRAAVRLRLAASVLGIGFDRLRQRDAQRRRRRLTQQAVGTVFAAAAVAVLTYRFAVASPCQDSPGRLAQVWNPEVQAVIRRVFLATDLPYAEDAWRRVKRRLDGYGNAWISMHAATCEATLVHEEQSPQLMDLRMACLNERRTEFDGLIQALAGADRELVERAVDVSGELRGLERCEDREALLAAYPMPEDARQRKAIERLRDDLALARARLAAGALDHVRGVVRDYVALAERYRFPALEAEALLLSGIVEQQSGRSDAAKTAFYSAAAKAVRAREGELVARAWITLSDLLVEVEGDTDEAMNVLQLAQSYIAQLAMGHPLEASFHNARARVLSTMGSYDQVVKDARVAVDIGLAGDLTTSPLYLTRLSEALAQLYRLDEAQAAADQALERAEQIFGRRHPHYASALLGAAGVSTLGGNHAEALGLRTQALDITEAAYPSGHPRVVTTLERLAWSLKETGRHEQAIAAAQRGLGVELAFEAPRWIVVSELHNTIGDARISMGDYPAAVESLEAALAAVRRSGNEPRVGLALNNLGNTANRTGDHAAAETYCREALTVDETYLAADHPDLGYALSCIGEALLGADKPGQAIAVLRRAHNVRDRIDIAEGSLAWTRWLYGRALWESGSNRSLGITYVRFALDVFRGMGDAARSELGDVEAWLNRNGLREADGTR